MLIICVLISYIVYAYFTSISAFKSFVRNNCFPRIIVSSEWALWQVRFLVTVWIDGKSVNSVSDSWFFIASPRAKNGEAETRSWSWKAETVAMKIQAVVTLSTTEEPPAPLDFSDQVRDFKFKLNRSSQRIWSSDHKWFKNLLYLLDSSNFR